MAEVNKGGDDERVQDVTEDRYLLNNFEKEIFRVDARPKCDEFLTIKKKSKVFSRMVKDVEILVNDACLLNDEDRSFEIPV